MGDHMAGQTIGGLFKDQARGEKALAELHAAKFASAQISEVVDGDDAPMASKKLGNPISEFFSDHTSNGSEFRDNLTELGMSEKDAHYFEDGVARGGALVTVKADARTPEALAILERNGADLGSQRRMASGASAVAAASMGDRDDDRDAAFEGNKTLQLKTERLAIDKVRVASGAVRIRKEVVTEKQELDVPVSHDELVIERRPVSGGAVGGTIGQDQTITVPLSREEVKVGKQTFVTEEVNIGKKAVVGNEKVSETIRHEELIVDGDEKQAKSLK